MAALGLGHNIRVLPFVDRPVLAALYRRASLVLLPSEREGFGLPLVEAMACGISVVASDLPVLREVGGDDGGLLRRRRRGRVERARACVARGARGRAGALVGAARRRNRAGGDVLLGPMR